MKLLTKEIRKKLPLIGTHRNTPDDQIPVVVKFFDPTGSWTWYATEATCYLKDGREVPVSHMDEHPEDEVEDVIFFGLVRGFETELGNFSFNELKSVKLPLGLGIERDMYFGKHTIAEARAKQL